MFIDKGDIEDFYKCAVGDILYKDPKDKKFMYRVYSRHNRTVMKLKSRPVMPDSLIAEIKEDGLTVQSINIYDDSLVGTITYGTNFTGSHTTTNWPYPGKPLNTTGGTATPNTVTTAGTFTTSNTTGGPWQTIKAAFTGKIKP